MGNTEAKERISLDPKTSVSFKLNGTSVEVQGVSPSLTLNSWLRTQPGMSGTKRMCGEGGCGCCVVAASLINPVTQKETVIAINSVRPLTDNCTSIARTLFAKCFVSACVLCCLWRGGR